MGGWWPKWGVGRTESRRRRQGPLQALERLECRRALSATPTQAPIVVAGTFEPAWLASSTALRSGLAAPQASSGPSGFTPAQIRHAYGFDGLTFDGVPADGTGTTIAIVTAYDSPNIATDLATFSATFGLPAPPSFRKVSQTGSAALPAFNAAWSSETCIDVEWAHAIAPGASILLVEAKTNSNTDLVAAVNFARSAPGVIAVSMSWGQGEYVGEKAFDTSFATPAGHPGVTFFAASGDSGAPGIYPAMSPNVVAVGGSSLKLGAGGSAIESGWSRSGGGISLYESRPAYQTGVVTQTTTKRANPDVSFVADPATGLAVCDSRANGANTPWAAYGGTSIAAPQWAGLAAIVAQGRALRGAASLDGAKEFLPASYALPATDFRDIVTGTSLGSPRYTAAAGYDLVTGRGSPVAGAVIRDLVAVGAPSTRSPPGVPAGFVAASTAPSTATLSWGAVPGANGYRLYEITGGARTLVDSYDATTTSATLTGLAPHSSHTWRLEAWNSAGTASATAQATIVAGMAAPEGVTVTAVSRTTIDVSWKGVGGATRYSVYQWSGRASRRLGGASAPATTTRITGLAPGSTVRIAVRAESGQTTATSEWISVTLPG